MITVCPKCTYKFDVRSETVGRTVPCPKCKALVLVSVGQGPRPTANASAQALQNVRWRIRYTTGQEVGPVTSEQLVTAFQKGTVTADCNIQGEGGGWKRAGEVARLLGVELPGDEPDEYRLAEAPAARSASSSPAVLQDLAKDSPSDKRAAQRAERVADEVRERQFKLLLWGAMIVVVVATAVPLAIYNGCIAWGVKAVADANNPPQPLPAEVIAEKPQQRYQMTSAGFVSVVGLEVFPPKIDWNNAFEPYASPEEEQIELTKEFTKLLEERTGPEDALTEAKLSDNSRHRDFLGRFMPPSGPQPAPIKVVKEELLQCARDRLKSTLAIAKATPGTPEMKVLELKDQLLDARFKRLEQYDERWPKPKEEARPSPPSAPASAP